MFLTLDKTWRRKLQETFLTYRMEHEFSKQEIFALYLNVIFFGQRAYGVAAAAETFFGKALDQLDRRTGGDARRVSCSCPRATTRSSTRSPRKARRTYVLRHMKDLGISMRTPPRRPMPRSRSRRVRTRRCSMSMRSTSPRWRRQEVRKRFGPKAENAGLPGLHHYRRPAADGRQPRGALRPDRVRPPLWLARPDRARDLAAGAEASDLEDLLDEYARHRHP